MKNKKTGGETVLYVKNFKEEIEGLLLGCYSFLELDKKKQGEYKKWKNRMMAVEYIDNCYK